MAVAYEYIRRNQRQSILFALLFPLSFVLFVYLTLLGFYVLCGMLAHFRPTGLLTWGSTWAHAWQQAWQTGRWVVPIALGLSVFWSYLALKEGEEFILGRIRGVRLLSKWDAHDVHVLLENLCLSTGDIVPRLYVLEDESMNAFSVGARPEYSSIVLSSGLLKKLDRSEIEAVLAHELAHIRNYDVRMMTILITCLAFFTFTGEYLFYGTEKDDIYDENGISLGKISRPMGPLAYVGLMLLVYGYVLAPLLRMGLSRSREQLADAQAALTTRYPRALARALWHISEDSRIEALDSSVLLGAMCIETPAGTPNFFERISGLSRAHPPVEERIYVLNDMDGVFLAQQR